MPIALNGLNTALWIYDIDNFCITWANSAALRLWDSPSLQEIQSRNFAEGTSEAVRETLLQYQKAFYEGRVIKENWAFSPKGKDLTAYCQFSGTTLKDGRMAMLVEATLSNLSELNHATSPTTIVSSYTPNGQFISGNPPFIKMFGTKPTSLESLFVNANEYKQVFDAFTTRVTIDKDVLLQTLNGRRWFRLQTSNSQHESKGSSLLLFLYDIDDHKNREEYLQHKANTDSLTLLLNRRGLTVEIKQRIESGVPFTLLYIDLDGFKIVNDSLGHQFGDKVLVEIAQRLTSRDDICGCLGRFGGDEFIFIVDTAIAYAEQLKICSSIINAISEPFDDLSHSALQISASIGVVQYPLHSNEIEHLITCADAAMYQAKSYGKKRWVAFQPGMEHAIKRVGLVAQKLSSALYTDELSLHYQPIVDLCSNTIRGFEALLRWNNPELGHINPEEAIKVATEIGLIHDLERWVFDQALSDLNKLKPLFTPGIVMSINVSAMHLSDLQFTQNVLATLDKHQILPAELMIELTEDTLIKDINNSNNQISKITQAGIKLSIDDFGTGYSSLAYLSDIPASVVKVDRSFVAGTNTNTNTLKFIKELVTSLNMECLIEGIESTSQKHLLQQLGYDLQQGYLHGKPKALSHYLQK